jgi:predicted transcriptional regulator
MSAANDPIRVMRSMVSSETRAELMMLFHRNPGLMDTVQGISRRVGNSDSVVEADLKELVGLGVLKNKKIGKSLVYSLDVTKDREIQGEITRSIRAMKGANP